MPHPCMKPTTIRTVTCPLPEGGELVLYQLVLPATRSRPLRFETVLQVHRPSNPYLVGSPEQARAIAQRAGILDKAGRLRKPFR